MTTPDPRIAAIVRGLGVFLQDHAEAASEYVAAALADVGLASPESAPQQRPVAESAPVLSPTAKLDVEAWWPSSPDAVWFRGADARGADAPGKYVVEWRKEGKPDTGVDIAIQWADGRFAIVPGCWRPTGNVPRGAPYRIAVHLAEPAK